MCDEFDSGLDSLDSDSEFVDDFSADDLSGTMDETSMLEDDMDSFDSFDEEVSGGDSDEWILWMTLLLIGEMKC